MPPHGAHRHRCFELFRCETPPKRFETLRQPRRPPRTRETLRNTFETPLPTAGRSHSPHHRCTPAEIASERDLSVRQRGGSVLFHVTPPPHNQFNPTKNIKLPYMVGVPDPFRNTSPAPRAAYLTVSVVFRNRTTSKHYRFVGTSKHLGNTSKHFGRIPRPQQKWHAYMHSVSRLLQDSCRLPNAMCGNRRFLHAPLFPLSLFFPKGPGPRNKGLSRRFLQTSLLGCPLIFPLGPHLRASGGALERWSAGFLWRLV